METKVGCITFAPDIDMEWVNSNIENAMHQKIEALPEESAMADMELRDWFAGQAIRARWGDGTAMTPEQAAEMAYQLADAMMSERSK